MEDRLERVERRLTAVENLTESLKKLVAALERRIFRIERHVFGPGFWGSAFGASLVIGAFLAWQKLTQGGP